MQHHIICTNIAMRIVCQLPEHIATTNKKIQELRRIIFYRFWLQSRHTKSSHKLDWAKRIQWIWIFTFLLHFENNIRNICTGQGTGRCCIWRYYTHFFFRVLKIKRSQGSGVDVVRSSMHETEQKIIIIICRRNILSFQKMKCKQTKSFTFTHLLKASRVAHCLRRLTPRSTELFFRQTRTSTMYQHSFVTETTEENKAWFALTIDDGRSAAEHYQNIECAGRSHRDTIYDHWICCQWTSAMERRAGKRANKPTSKESRWHKNLDG